MFTMAKIRDGSTYLGNHLCANDYYSEDEKVSGVWQGELARAWGIEGQRIEAGDTRFENLRVGLTPDGQEKLTQRGGGDVRFYDFQCAAAKSVSVQSMLDARLAEAHERAAKVAFSELERFAARQVQGKASRHPAPARGNGPSLRGGVPPRRQPRAGPPASLLTMWWRTSRLGKGRQTLLAGNP